MNKFSRPTTDFNSVRDGRNAPDFYFDLDLSVRFDRLINVAGNSFYCDANPADGDFVVYFQETDSQRGPTPFYASPGFIARIPFTQIRVVNQNAQVGKKARIVYGTDTDFQPGSVAKVSLEGSIQPETAPLGAGFPQLLDLAAIPLGAGGVTIVTPGNNSRGIVVYGYSQAIVSAAAQWARVGLCANNGFPASIDSSSILIHGVTSINAVLVHGQEWSYKRLIPAGLGLYLVTDSPVAGGSTRGMCYFEVL